MDIRACTVADIADVQAVYAHHVRSGFGTFEEEPPSIAEMRQRFDALVAQDFPFRVAVIDGRFAGYAYAGPFRSRAAYRHTCETSVYVAPDAQRRGVGRELMLGVIEECQRLGKRQMLAVIGDSANAASIGLHSALGFASVGVFKNIGYKFGRWVDVVLMQRAL
jgi:L-amino acid N-acyltransferase YncA